MTHVTCRLAAKNRDRLRNPTLCDRVRSTFTFTSQPAACGLGMLQPLSSARIAYAAAAAGGFTLAVTNQFPHVRQICYPDVSAPIYWIRFYSYLLFQKLKVP